MDVSIFTLSVDDVFICCICSNVMLKPVCCRDGHCWCESCIHEWLSANETCPMGRDELHVPDLTRNRPLEQIISRMEVRCALKSKGCDWTGEVQNRQRHLDNECAYEQVECSYEQCSSSVQRRNLMDECDGAPIPCPHGCSDNAVSRGSLGDHENVCSHIEVPCPFATFGCTHNMTRENVGAHVEANQNIHLSMVGDKTNKEISDLKLSKTVQAGEISELRAQLSKKVRVSWVIPNFQQRLNAGEPIKSRKVTPCFVQNYGNCPTWLAMHFVREYIGLYICCNLPTGDSISIEGSTLRITCPYGTNGDENTLEENSTIATDGGGFGCATFILKDECLQDYLFPDGSLHVEADVVLTSVENNERVAV